MGEMQVIEDISEAAMQAIEREMDFDNLYSHGVKNTTARDEMKRGIADIVSLTLSGDKAFKVTPVPVSPAWIDRMKREQGMGENIQEDMAPEFELVIDEIINGPTSFSPSGIWRYPQDITIGDIYRESDDRHNIYVKGTVTKDGQSADVEFQVDGEHSIAHVEGDFEELGISVDAMGDYILSY